MSTATLSATDSERQRRWNEVLRLKQAALLRGGKIRIANALEGDAPELVRARYWQGSANRHGLESFYLSNLAAETSREARAELDAGNETRAQELRVTASEIRKQAEEARHRYEVAGSYDAEAMRQVIQLELRERIAAAGAAPRFTATRSQLVETDLRNAKKRAREADHASSSSDLAQRLTSAPANAPGLRSLKTITEGALAKLS